MKSRRILAILVTGILFISLSVGCQSLLTTTQNPAGNQNAPTPTQGVAATQASSPPPLISISPSILTVSSSGPVINLPSFADMLDATEHSVVKIDTTSTGQSFFGAAIQLQGAGSGWILDPSGIIVTNDHVVSGANTINVTTLDGKTYPAQIIKTDQVSDLSLIKITASGLASLQIGDASKLRVGDWVVAIGNPLGEGIIATEGIVSRLKVNLPLSSTQNYNDLIETTAAINPGNSGGPLVNLAGQVVGITSAKVSLSGIEGMGYAINMVDALPVLQQLATP